MNENHDEQVRFAAGSSSKAEASSKTAHAYDAKAQKGGSPEAMDRLVNKAYQAHRDAAQAHKDAAQAHRDAASKITGAEASGHELKAQYHDAMAQSHSSQKSMYANQGGHDPKERAARLKEIRGY